MYTIGICIYYATHNFYKAKQFKIKYTFQSQYKSNITEALYNRADIIEAHFATICDTLSIIILLSIHFVDIFKKHNFCYSLRQASYVPFILSYFRNLFKDVFNKSKDQFTCDIPTKLQQFLITIARLFICLPNIMTCNVPTCWGNVIYYWLNLNLFV